jgi:hypothetical protein
MNNLEIKITEWFLRIALSTGLLSAVGDRFGFWSRAHSTWGNWENFLAYTQKINPLVPQSLIPLLGGFATFLEIGFALGLLSTFKTEFFAKGTGVLLLLFGLTMTFTLSIKAPLDYSVFIGSAAAFALSILMKKQPLAAKDLA